MNPSQLIFFIGAMAFVLLLISISFKFLKLESLELKISGSKEDAISTILDQIYECRKKCRPKMSVICKRIILSIQNDIKAEEIEGRITKEIGVKVEDIPAEGEIVIRCEEKIVFVENVGERISA